MKKSISLVLCLVMLVSAFSCLGVVASAAEAKDLFTVKDGGAKNNKLTYTVYLNKNVNLYGTVIYAQFDTSVLSIDEANTGAYMVSDGDGGKRENVTGYYESGFMVDSSDKYSVGYMYAPDRDYKVGSSNKAFVTFTFNTIAASRPKTTVKFYCHEFRSENKPANNIKNGSAELIKSISSKTLGQTKLKSISSEKSGVKITWEKTTGADYYRVFKKVDGKYVQLFDTADGNVTSYIDKKVSNNKSYTYTVRAFNEAGVNSSYDKTGLKTTYTKAPGKLTVKNTEDGVTVSWSKVKGATRYRLYKRTVKADGTKSKWSSVSKKLKTTEYTDKKAKSGTTYEYAVRTYNGSNYSALYSAKKIVRLGFTDTKLKATVGGVKVSWNKVSGATEYKIYRKAKGDKSWKLIKTASSKAKSYTDKSAPSNKKISYIVKASKDSSLGAYEKTTINYLKTPEISVKNISTGVKVSWDKVSGATEYYVYRKVGSAKSWKKIATTKKARYTDKTVQSGKTYKYCVRAANSSLVSAYGGSSYEKIRFISQPELTKVSSGKKGVTVKWGEVSGADGYIIYRKTGSGYYKELATVEGKTTVKYLDKSAKKGKKYTYKVCACYGSYKSSNSSTRSVTDKY